MLHQALLPLKDLITGNVHYAHSPYPGQEGDQEKGYAPRRNRTAWCLRNNGVVELQEGQLPIHGPN